MAILFFSGDTRIPPIPRIKLRRFLKDLFLKEGRPLAGLNYIFCSDEYLLSMNSQYLNHHYYTDILTFDMSGADKAIQGDIYISVDRVRDNAQKLGEPISKELLRVIFHGALHLCGYKDKTPAHVKQMRQKEDYYIEMFHK